MRKHDGFTPSKTAPIADLGALIVAFAAFLTQHDPEPQSPAFAPSRTSASRTGRGISSGVRRRRALPEAQVGLRSSEAQVTGLTELLFSPQYHLYMADSGRGLNETSLRQRLKRETTAEHQHLEDQLGLLDPTLDVHRYLRVLERFYGFYVPVEIDLAGLAAAQPLGFPLRARAELIARDLLALGRSPAELAALPLCRDRPELSCVEDLAGCLYVLEGACLGGQVLTPLLHQRLGLAKDGGAAFFAGDEEWTLPRWTVVVAWLDGLPRTGASTAQIIRTAKATFDALARWAAVARGGLPWPM